MNKLLLAVLMLPSLASAFDHDHHIDWAELRRERREAAEREQSQNTGFKPATPAPAVPGLLGATIGRGVFQGDYDVKQGASTIGSIESVSGGYVYKDAQGRIVATLVNGQVKDGTGASIGSIEQSYGDSCSVFSVKDAAGSVVAGSGCVEGSSFDLVLGGEPRAIVKNAHWLEDRYQVTALDGRVDSRLLAFTIVEHNTANYKRAQARNRERMADRPGRGDRI